MSYSTGAGDYLALMAAVLAHAVADGWVEAGGIGTGWPISKGTIRGVDWDTYTQADTDFLTGAGIPHTTRWINIAAGSTTGDATTRANNGEGAHFPNMEFAIDQWYIFSDSSICDHVNVVVRFSNGIDAQVFGHFSFGELDKHGMGYSGLAYVTSHPARGFSPDTKNSPDATNDANNGVYTRAKRIFTAQLGFNGSVFVTNNNLSYMLDPTTPPVSVLPIWPQPDILHGPEQLMDVYGPSSGNFNTDTAVQGGFNMRMSAAATFATAQAYSGGVSLSPLPFLLANSTTNSATLQYMTLGDFANVRVCSMANYLPGDEIVFGSETWVLFPFVCKKDRSTLGGQYVVTSGEHALAYKKVV